MKVKVYVARTFTIDSKHLPKLAKAARAKRKKRSQDGVGMHELVEEARLAGLIDLPEDYSFPLEDERHFMCGRLMSWREWSERMIQRIRNRKKRGSKNEQKKKRQK